MDNNAHSEREEKQVMDKCVKATTNIANDDNNDDVTG